MLRPMRVPVGGVSRLSWQYETDGQCTSQGGGWAAAVVPAAAGGCRATLMFESGEELHWPDAERELQSAEHCRRWVRRMLVRKLLHGPRTLAENVAESLKTGARVLVSGRMQTRSWETEDGQRRSAVEIEAEEIAASMRFAAVAVTNAARGQAP